MLRRVILASMAGLILILGPFGIAWARNSLLLHRIIPFRSPPRPPLSGGVQESPPQVEHERAKQTWPNTVFRYGDRRIREVAITFDDGPDLEWTPQVLEVLRRKRARATFYFTGTRTRAYPEVAQQVLREGHEIGNHSYDHPHMGGLEPHHIRYQIQITDDILESKLGRRPLTFRPPYGEVSPTVLLEAHNLGHRVILWDIDTLDWKGLSREQILARTIPNLRPGSIVLMHSASGGPKMDLSGMVQALPELIDEIRARGLKLVTISEMFGIIRCCP